MDITEISQALGLSSGKVALALVVLRLIGETIGSLRNGGGLVGWFRSVLYGQSVPKPIAQDYKQELKADAPKASGGALTIILAGMLTIGALSMTGCASLAPSSSYDGDKALYIADQTDLAAYKVMHAFVSFEYDNRAALASHPEIKEAADEIRKNAPDWFAKYDKARAVYVNVRSPETLAAFNLAVQKLKDGVTKATNSLFSAQSLIYK